MGILALFGYPVQAVAPAQRHPVFILARISASDPITLASEMDRFKPLEVCGSLLQSLTTSVP